MTVDVKARKRRATRSGKASPRRRPRRQPPARAAQTLAQHPPGRPRAFSPLTLRILALNVLALGILVGGLLYLGGYQRSLIDSELEALGTQGRIFAAALGEGAVITDPSGLQRINPNAARQMVRGLVAPTETRARLFDHNGVLVTDSRELMAAGGVVVVEELPPPSSESRLGQVAVDLYDWIVDVLPAAEGMERYRESPIPRARDYTEAMLALAGEAGGAVRLAENGGMVLSFAVPVQRYKKVVGALFLSTGSGEIEASVRAVRLEILKIFGVVLALTVLLSFYLAGAIARPIRRLAAAAERVRRRQGGREVIPDFTRRRDEIGDLSAALRDMTDELWHRMEAIESFAADVAHEIKNPLTSLRSAVETAARIADPARQRQLMTIILEDVERLDRLITDISRASRLDTELSRAEPERVDVAQMLTAAVEVHGATADAGAPRLRLELPDEPAELIVLGVEDRLVQVLQNLLANAISFSPPGGTITVSAEAGEDDVVVAVEDQGPGIPEANLEAIFDRFYSERPVGEKFGTHSGLGLSISRQIIDAHFGSIHAENLRGPEGEVAGARVVIHLHRI